MKVALSTIGKFHTFDLARQLHAQAALAAIFTGYPRFKLSNEKLPRHLVRTFPWIQAPYMAFGQRDRFGHRAVWEWEHLARETLDAHVALNLPSCDVFVGLSGSALRTGLAAKRRGAYYVCDRGSAHIREQDRLLREEHERWSLPFAGIDPRAIDKEEAEYAAADLITVPSTFAHRSFVKRGVPANKLRKLPYGVDLSRFHPSVAPVPNEFNVLFVGAMTLQKGVPYLTQAYLDLVHPRKSLTFAGSPSQVLIDRLKSLQLWPEDARVLGHVPQPLLKDLFSRSHVLVLPSIQEGMAMVQAQAMACGSVVVGTEHSGAEDLLTDGLEGFVLPARDTIRLTETLQRLADDPLLVSRMRQAALNRVASIGGWSQYGAQALAAYQDLVA
jgi:alpha-maltose-1-phosphate synthase